MTFKNFGCLQEKTTSRYMTLYWLILVQLCHIFIATVAVDTCISQNDLIYMH